MTETILLSDHVGEKSDQKFLSLLECRYMLIFDKIKELREHLDHPQQGEFFYDWMDNMYGVDLALVWGELQQLEREMNADLRAMAARAVRVFKTTS